MTIEAELKRKLPDDTLTAWLLNGIGREPTEMAVVIVKSGDYTFIAKALPGTAAATAAWQALCIDKSVAGTTRITWADGDADFDNVATNIAGLSYA